MSFNAETGEATLCTVSERSFDLRFDTADGRYGFPVAHLDDHARQSLPVIVDVGAAAATDGPLVVRNVGDAAVLGTPSCRNRPRSDGTFMAVLPDGRTYRISGLPDSVLNRVQVRSVSLPLVVRWNSEWVPLGVASVLAVTGGPGDDDGSEVMWDGEFLRLRTPGWRIDIHAYDDGSLDAERRRLLARSIDVASVERVPVLDVSGPLRFAAVDELPVELATDYGAFKLGAGCPALRKRIRCGESGSVHLEVNPNGMFEVDDLEIELVG